MQLLSCYASGIFSETLQTHSYEILRKVLTAAEGAENESLNWPKKQTKSKVTSMTFSFVLRIRIFLALISMKAAGSSSKLPTPRALE